MYAKETVRYPKVKVKTEDGVEDAELLSVNHHSLSDKVVTGYVLLSGGRGRFAAADLVSGEYVNWEA